MFSLSRIDPVDASVSASGRRIEGLPLFDGGFTSPDGVRGRVGLLGSDADIGLAEAAPNMAGTGAVGDARRQNRHRAIVLVTRGGRPGLCPNNAESFLQPFGSPVVQVSSTEKGWLDELARSGSEALVVVQIKRTPEAFNVIASIPGSDRSLTPLVIMTPRSGWWTCASERGGGIVCWLELMRALRGTKPAREVLFVASSGHELGQRGIKSTPNASPTSSNTAAPGFTSAQTSALRKILVTRCRLPMTRWKHCWLSRCWRPVSPSNAEFLGALSQEGKRAWSTAAVAATCH